MVKRVKGVVGGEEETAVHLRSETHVVVVVVDVLRQMCAVVLLLEAVEFVDDPPPA